MRIRSVKPEFWTDRKTTGRWPADMRLVYSALWCYADDAGRFELELVPLKAALFPYGCKLTEGGPELDFEGVLERLIACDRLAIYSVDGFLFGFLPKMGAHQHPNRPTPSKFPEYSEALRVQWSASSRINSDSLSEGSVRAHGGLTPVVGEGEGVGEVVGDLLSADADARALEAVEQFVQLNATDKTLEKQSTFNGPTPDDLQSLWNEIAPPAGLPEWQSPTTGQRLAHAKARIHERRAWTLRGPSDSWEACFRSVAASDFLAGRKTEFKASAGWILKPENFAKVLEGNYDNRAAPRRDAARGRVGSEECAGQHVEGETRNAF